VSIILIWAFIFGVSPVIIQSTVGSGGLLLPYNESLAGGVVKLVNELARGLRDRISSVG
jgi:hypothetical protein